MFEIPIHIKKLVKDYTAGKIKPADVEYTPDEADVTRSVFKFTLPMFDVLGDPAGTHEFALTVESLVSTKTKLAEEMDKDVAKYDEYIKDHDALIAVLQDIKNKKAR